MQKSPKHRIKGTRCTVYDVLSRGRHFCIGTLIDYLSKVKFLTKTKIIEWLKNGTLCVMYLHNKSLTFVTELMN